MKLESMEKKYTLYYDESNNVRKLLLSGSEFNIDRDPNQDSSPIFILAVTQEDVLAFSQILGIPDTLATKQLHLIASSIYDESSILTDKLNNYLIVQRELTN
jgi:hypothetical protein